MATGGVLDSTVGLLNRCGTYVQDTFNYYTDTNTRGRKDSPFRYAVQDTVCDTVRTLARTANTGYVFGYNVFALCNAAVGWMRGDSNYQNASPEERSFRSLDQFRVKAVQDANSNPIMTRLANLTGAVFAGLTVFAITVPVCLAYKGVFVGLTAAKAAMVYSEYSKSGSSEILKAAKDSNQAINFTSWNDHFHQKFNEPRPYSHSGVLATASQALNATKDQLGDRAIAAAENLVKAYVKVGGDIGADIQRRLQ